MRGEKRILIVDDDDAIRTLLFTVLRRRGLQVDTARNGVEAMERCGNCRYSVVLLDLMMPLMSGWDVLARLAKIPASQRPFVIVLTAGMEPRNLDPCLVAATLRKPFDIDMLVDTVSACLVTMEMLEQPPDCPPADSEQNVTKDTPN